MTTLTTAGLTVKFGGHIAVNNVSCTINPSELTAIVGPNGAGKTTFFNLISGQLRPTDGSVMLGDLDITKLSPTARARRGIGRAFQLTNLFPALTVAENLRLVIQARNGRGLTMLQMAQSDPEQYAEVTDLLQACLLTAAKDVPVHALPHGAQRKLEVAMLIAMKPRVFMFDEPTAGMSGDEVPAILELINGIKADPSCLIMLVEHKIDVISFLADRIIVLVEGRLVADGSPQEVMESPIVRSAYFGDPVPEQAHG